MGNPFVRSGLSFSVPTSILPPLKPLHETLLTRIPIGFPKHSRTLPPHSSSSSSNFDIISTTESWDGSLLFRFGDESEKSVTTETGTDAQSHLEDLVQDSKLSQTLLGRRGSGGAAAEADETVDADSATSTDGATGGGGEETTTTRSITTITTTTTSTEDETQLSNEIHAFPAIGTTAAEAKENAVDAVSMTSTSSATGRGDGGEKTTTSTNETQVSKEIHAFPAIGTAAAEAKENVVDAVSVTSTNNATGGGSGGGEETTTTTTITATTIADETQVSNEIHAFPAIGGAEAEENAVDAVSVTSIDIVTGGGSGGGEETTTTTTRTATTVESQVSYDIHAEGEENAADAVSVTSTSMATGGEETTTEETQVSNEIHVFPANGGAKVEENAVDAVSVTGTGIATGGGEETTTTTTTTTDETQVSNEIHVFPAISSAETEENAVDAVSVMSTGIVNTTEETQVSNDIHAFPAIGGAEENAVEVVSVMSTSTATGGGSGGGEETTTTTTTTTRTTTDETQVSNEIFAFPAISGSEAEENAVDSEAEENAVDAVSVASINIATGGSSSGGQETTTTTTTDETQVSNDIHAQAEENAVDAVSVTISNNATSGGGEETTTTITTTATTTTTSDETQVSPVLAENAHSTNSEDEFTEGKADTTDVSGVSTSRIVEFNTVEGASDGEDATAAVLQLSSSAALLPHPSKVGRMLTLLLAKIG